MRVTPAEPEKRPIIMAQVLNEDPASGWKKILLDGDPITALGSQGQALLQRATTYDLIVQLRNAGDEIDPRQIRALTSSDVVTVQGITNALPAGTNIIGYVNLAPDNQVLDGAQVSGTFSPAAAGSTTIISSVSGNYIRVYDFSLWNSGTADVGITLYFGTSGKNLFKGKLSAKTGVAKSFVRPWRSNASDSLVLALDAAGTVDYCIAAVGTAGA
jgi:hypothetical protein